MGAQSDGPLGQLATEQGGPVARRQAIAAGLTRRQIARRLETGRWHEVFPTVYAIGHRAMTPKGWLMAAVLAGGPGAVASHRSAAWWHGLLQTSRSRHDVTTKTHRRSGRIDFHRNRLADADVTTREGVPVTTVARTLLDLAEAVPPRQVERAVEQAAVHDLLDMRAIAEVLGRSNGRRTEVLTTALERHAGGSTLTKSELEERFLALIDAAGIPRPQINVQLHGFEVDVHWPHLALVVEIDGHRFHRTRAKALRDRRGERALRSQGLEVLRFGHDEITGDPAEVLAALASARCT